MAERTRVQNYTRNLKARASRRERGTLHNFYAGELNRLETSGLNEKDSDLVRKLILGRMRRCVVVPPYHGELDSEGCLNPVYHPEAGFTDSRGWIHDGFGNSYLVLR
ncbi:MAG: hypothetical protein AABX96_01285 [Nanoarchaeota archaeon]